MNNLISPQLTRKVIIGTKSKSRRSLFKGLNLKFSFRSANIQERKVSNLKNDKNDAVKIAIAKARHLSNKYKDKIIITFDTTILFKKKIVYKCKTPECCSELLYSLNNKNHFLYTGMIFMVNNKIIKKKLTKTKVSFGNNDKENIELYVKNNFSNIRNAVGCYNIEGSGINLFKNINKSYFNVLGLDIISFLKFMRKV
tara:strand:+ start:757 stop:1350 length:594 start_codon:yes stop_codon:yes gene_type:complete